jgi:hypothetical protein
MAAQIITTEDLYIFKQELLQELKDIIVNLPTQQKKWLKSPEVRKMLGISPGTLQNLRINGTLPYTKIGGVVYYAYDDIVKVIERNQKNKLS